MSDEDIRIKLTADDSGAVAAFKRLKSQVSASDEGLKQLSTQGKQTGQALKDVAGMLGPEFQVLGDRLDQITGAMGDIKGAGIMAKAAMAGVVAVGAFEVGQAIGNIVFETERWKEMLAATREEATRLNQELARGAQKRAQELSTEQVQRELEGTIESVSTLAMRIAELKQEQLQADVVSSSLGIGAFAERREEIETLEQELQVGRELRDMYRETLNERQAAMAKEAEAAAARAAADAMRAREAEAAQQQQLLNVQADYLASLDAELVRLKEGEEAYLRLTLAKQGFTDQTINAAVAMKAEADAIREQARRAGETGTPGGQSDRQTMPGMVQATQQRFITRGDGNSEMRKLIDAQKEAVRLQKQSLEVANRMEQTWRRLEVE